MTLAFVSAVQNEESGLSTHGSLQLIILVNQQSVKHKTSI